MKQVVAATTTEEMPAVEQVHPMKKSHTLISTKHVDLDNLTAIEAVSMSFALVLAVTIGVLQSTVLS